MRGADREQAKLFSYVSPEQRVPTDHPLRTIRQLANQALARVAAALFHPSFWALRLLVKVGRA